MAARPPRRRRRPGFPAEIREQILKRDNYTCQRCGLYDPSGGTVDADHIIPTSWGGDDTVENGRSLCDRCHSLAEGGRTNWDWLARRNPFAHVFDF